MDNLPIVKYIVENREVIKNIDFWKEIFMVPERLFASGRVGEYFVLETNSPLYRGKLFVFENKFFGVDTFERIDGRNTETKIFHITAIPLNLDYKENSSDPICTPQDEFSISKGDIENYNLNETCVTTVGIYLANYIFLVYPFGDIIPYINEEISVSKLQRKMVVPLLDDRIKTSDIKDKYINALSLFGQANEMICPGITEKTITIPKHITELRESLIEQNKEALDRGDASVMSDVEQKLISAYKEYLRGDESLDFLLKEKYFKVAMKKLLLTQGMVEQFGSPGRFSWVSQPMGSGWKQEDLPIINNEVRQGSFARAVETADGGVIAKLILRVFQDTRIVTPDCGTKRGQFVQGGARLLREFSWNYIIEEDGSNTILTDENIPSLIDKPIRIRTPGYCQAKEGYCAKCFGKPFEVLGQTAFAPVANDFAKTQTTASLKKMHGSSHSNVDVSDINKYLMI